MQFLKQYSAGEAGWPRLIFHFLYDTVFRILWLITKVVLGLLIMTTFLWDFVEMSHTYNLKENLPVLGRFALIAEAGIAFTIDLTARYTGAQPFLMEEMSARLAAELEALEAAELTGPAEDGNHTGNDD